ncbi:aspartate--tRNA ligase [Candidatus Saccharibacteria bacterium]|nr:aspartate--tRNA ligase [Candidatus Saccharibacteria bacterium]
MRILTKNIIEKVDQEVTLSGWVHARRDHGGLVFVDLRDESGIAQLTFHPENTQAFAAAETLRDEFVVHVSGIVKKRAPELFNPNIETGEFEVLISNAEILNKSEPLPIQINSTQTLNEDNRLKYRYLDLRRPTMQTMLKRRSQYYQIIRSFMQNLDFIEVSTPVLANSSPEGARDFLVPSRVHAGQFYALPQAPQQFKQLLMVGGVPRYYQIATCFRDEDPRSDRLYGDFYQLDLEMAFVENGEDIRTMMEPLIVDLVKNFANKELVSEEIPRISYTESMNRFGTDKPDLRYTMELVDLTGELTRCEFGVFANAIAAGGVVKAICVKDSSALSRSQIDKFTEIAKSEGAGGLAYMTVQDGQLVSPITKFFSSEQLQLISGKLQAEDGDTIFFGSDTLEKVNKVLGRLRTEFAEHFNLKDSNKVALAWVVDFPFYEWDDKLQKLDFGHNPFSMPLGGETALDSDDKRSIVADQYDMVMNGYEICSGAVRNHSPEIMYKSFGVLGYDTNYVDQKFGAMINAFKYGAPPHAGCAFGLDRMFMVLTGEENIRDVVAFPKNGSGVDVMMNSPIAIDQKQLDELSISVKN